MVIAWFQAIYFTGKNIPIGSRVESEVAGFFEFSHIWMMGYFRLDYSRMKECPSGLELSTRARNRIKIL